MQFKSSLAFFLKDIEGIQVTAHKTLLENAFLPSSLALTPSKLLRALVQHSLHVHPKAPPPEQTPQWYILGMLLIVSNRKPNRPYGLNHKYIVYVLLNRMPRNTWSQGRFRHSTVSSSKFCLSLHPVKLALMLVPDGHKMVPQPPKHHTLIRNMFSNIVK